MFKYKYYITVSSVDSKDVLIVDKFSYNTALSAIKSGKDFFINLNLDEPFKNNQRVTSRLINTKNIISLNIVEIKDDLEINDKNLIDDFSSYIQNYVNRNSYARKFLKVEENLNSFPTKINVAAWVKRHNFYQDTVYGYKPIEIISDDSNNNFNYFEIGCCPRWKNEDTPDDLDVLKKAIAKQIVFQENTQFLISVDSKVPKDQQNFYFNHLVKNDINLAISKINKHNYDAQLNGIEVEAIILSSELQIYIDEIFNNKFIKNKKYQNDDILSIFGWYKDIPIYLSVLLPLMALIIPKELGSLLIKNGIHCTDKIEGSQYKGLDIVEDIAINITNPKGTAKVSFENLLPPKS